MKNNDTDNNKSRHSRTGTAENGPISHGGSGVQRLQRYRDDLQDLADSDLPVAWVADALLDVADDVDGDTSDSNGGDTDR